ncbi:hypothetical protein ACO0KZ_16280 [Undibacterium sp. Di24W]
MTNKPIQNTQAYEGAKSIIKKVFVELKPDGESNLHREKITEADIPLIEKLEFRDWCGNEFDIPQLLRLSTWIVNQQKSIILIGLGGGCFEIPEMYDFVYNGIKIRIHCGGGGASAKTFIKMPDQSVNITFHVTEIQIPQELGQDQDAILTLAAEALAVEMFGSNAEVKLTVEFKLLSSQNKKTLSDPE